MKSVRTRRTPVGDAEWIRLLTAQPAPWPTRLLLTVAIAVIGLIGAATAVVHASYTGAEDRSMARTTTVIEDDEDTTAIALWTQNWDLIDYRYLAVHYFVPLEADAPAPVGLSEWPEPGEVAISPALTDPAYATLIAERFGTVVATIGSEALASPTELLVYSVPYPEIVDTTQMDRISEFHGLMPPFGEFLNHQPKIYFYGAMLPLLLVGALPLLVVSARLGDDRMTEARMVLSTLGASRIELYRLSLARLRRPVVIGLAAAVVALIPIFLVNLPILGTEFVLDARDTRRYAWLVAVGLFSFTTLAVLVALRVSSTSLVRRRQHPPRFSGLRSNRALALVFLMSAASIAPVNAYFAERTMAGAGTAVYIASMTVALLTLPAFVDVIVRSVSRLVAHVGARRGRSHLLLAGRQLFADPRASARVSTSLVLCLLVLTQVHLWSGLLTLGDAQPEDLDERVVRSGSSRSAESWEPVTVALDQINAAWIGVDSASLHTDTLTIVGSAANLAAAGLDLGLGSIDELQLVDSLRDHLSQELEWYERIEASEQMTSTDLQLVAFSLSDEPLPIDEIQQTVRTVTAPPPSLYPDGTSWVASGRLAAAHASWVSLFGTIGASLLLAAILLSTAAESTRSRVEVGPLAAIAASDEVVRRTARTRLALPVVLGLSIGIALAYAASAPFTHPSIGITTPWSFIVVLSGLAVLAAWVIGSLLADTTLVAVRQWLPGDTDISERL